MLDSQYAGFSDRFCDKYGAIRIIKSKSDRGFAFSA